MDALGKGLHQNSLDGFYQVARCLLCPSEVHYDAFDLAFAESFKGVVTDMEALLGQLDEWLANPKLLEDLDAATAAMLEGMDLEALRQQVLDRLAKQTKRHEGGNRMIGTGGTSPHGQGGQHPTGVRMGGGGGGRSALAVADARRFSAFRRDLVLDTRQMASALRRLRKLGRESLELELDLDATVDETARNCGDLEVVWRPPRKNDVRMLLLLDVGGSMDPHAQMVSRLFSAAHKGGGFRELKHFYFHNCVYSKVYEDARFYNAKPVSELFRELDSNWYLVLVGDAWMHPGELTMSSGDFWNYARGPSGLTWLARLADHFPRNAWINPEPKRVWNAPTVRSIAEVFPMFELTLEGLGEMAQTIRRTAPPGRRALISQLAGGSADRGAA